MATGSTYLCHVRKCCSPNIFWGYRPPNDVRTRRNGDTVAFRQIGMQRNALLTSMSGQLAHTYNTQQTHE